MVQPPLYFEVHGRRAAIPKPARGKKKTAEEEPPLELLATIERADSCIYAEVPHKRIRLRCPLDNISILEKLLGVINIFSYETSDHTLTCTNSGDVWEVPAYCMAEIAYIVLYSDFSRNRTGSSSPSTRPTLSSHCLSPEGECAT